MAKKQRIILIEGDKYFDMLNNHMIADENNYQTPEHIVADEISKIIEKINVLMGTGNIVKNGIVKLVLSEKMEAYKDCSESLIKISQHLNQFLTKKIGE